MWKKGTALVPSFTAFAVVTLLEQHFPTWSTTRSPPAWRTTSTRSRAATARWCRGSPTSTSGPTATASARGGLKELVSDRLDEIDARPSTPSRSASTRTAQLIVAARGRYGPVPRAGRGPRQHPRGPAARRAHGREGGRAARRAEGRPRASATIRPRGCRSTPRPAASVPTCSSASSTTGDGEAEDGVAVQDDGARDGHARRRARAAVAAAGRRSSTRAGEEIVAHNGRYGPVPQEGHRHDGRSSPRSSSSPSPSTTR